MVKVDLPDGASSEDSDEDEDNKDPESKSSEWRVTPAPHIPPDH